MKAIYISLRFFLLFTVITGIMYPMFVTGFAQLFFREKANGSLIYKENTVVGSRLAGQFSDNEKYFYSRPSAVNYQPLPSAGSNLGPTSAKLAEQVKTRRAEFIRINQLPDSTSVPADMLYASASGIDPHISVLSARLQAGRVAKNRGFSPEQLVQLYTLIDKHTEQPVWHLLGETRINVLELNLELDLMNTQTIKK
jgi:K+-transporting ATPase ATPase C chain